MYPVARAAWFAAVLVTVAPAVASAQFVRIADTGTASPSGPFTQFHPFPAVSGGTVAFNGAFAGQMGIFTGSGGSLQTLATSATSIPGGGGTFNVLGSPTISGSAVVFTGGQAAAPPAPGATYRGVYTAPAAGGAVTQVVGPTTTNPGPPPAPFAGFFDLAPVGGTTVQFAGGSFQRGGVYTAPVTGAATATVIAQIGEPAPNGLGGFTGVYAGAVSAGRVIFAASSAPFPAPGPINGVYTAATTGGPLTVVADATTFLPGSATQRFGQFGRASLSGSVAAFTGSAAPIGPLTGVYATTGAGGSLATIANTSTIAPGGGGTLLDFGPPVGVAGDDVVFLSRTANGVAIYTNATGPLTRVVGVGDMLDGRSVRDVTMGMQAFDGTYLTFWADFTNNTSGIYVVPVAPVPEPAGVLAVGVAAAGLLRVVRRRRRT